MSRTLVLLSLVVAVTLTGCDRSSPQQDFASADDAVKALVAAARADDTTALLRLLGDEAKPLVDSGDSVQDKNARTRFVEAYDAAHALDGSVAGVTTLNVGADQWPFPFPLAMSEGRWRFDSAAGVEEIINRRVGANELSAIQSCLAFVDAQREYYARNAEADALLHFASKLVSSEGRKDGLYWPSSGDEPPSPLGEAFAQARSEGYFGQGTAKGQPFHGYIYRLLTAQGPNAAGGAYDYMVGDKMLGGFALIAFPAEYGASGVMTFVVNHDGKVFSKDLGADTPKAAMAIQAFDPDQSWKREAAID